MDLVPVRTTFDFSLFSVRVLNVSLICERVAAPLIIKIKNLRNTRSDLF